MVFTLASILWHTISSTINTGFCSYRQQSLLCSLLLFLSWIFIQSLFPSFTCKKSITKLMRSAQYPFIYRWGKKKKFKERGSILLVPRSQKEDAIVLFNLKRWNGIPSVPRVSLQQVGNSTLDHNFWGRPEDMLMERPAFKIDRENPGKGVSGNTFYYKYLVSISRNECSVRLEVISKLKIAQINV